MNKKEPLEIVICMGSSCFSRGNKETLARIQEYIRQNDLNGSVHMSGCLCENHCNEGPVMQVNGTLFREIDPGSAIDIIVHAMTGADG